MTPNTNFYFSKSKQQYIPIKEMEKWHLRNAITKCEREGFADSQNCKEVYDNMLNELNARENGDKIMEALNKEEVTPTPVETTTIKPTTETISVSTSDIPMGITPEGYQYKEAPVTEAPAITSASIMEQLTKTINNLPYLFSYTKPTEEQVQTLTKLVNELMKGVVLPANTIDAISLDTPLNELPAVYGALNSALLLNSLASYGVTTVRQLNQLSASDFGCIRFSTAEAFTQATNLFFLLSPKQIWNSTSVVLCFDGHINPILNPNASTIEVFVAEAEQKLDQQIKALLDPDNEMRVQMKVQRIFNGIKTRLSLAVKTLGTLMLTRGFITDELASTYLNNIPNLSVAFKGQVIRYVQRTMQRIERARVTPTPVTTV